MLARRLRRLPRPGLRCISEAELNPNRELGFSFPAPRVLGEIAKVDLLRQEEPDAIREIWQKHHEGSENALATDIPAEDFRTIVARGRERCAERAGRAASRGPRVALTPDVPPTSPFFVFPVHREGGFFTLLSQFQDKYCLFTYLDDYKANPATAQPYLTLTLYDDLVEDKGLALARGDYGLLLGREVRQPPPPHVPPRPAPRHATPRLIRAMPSPAGGHSPDAPSPPLLLGRRAVQAGGHFQQRAPSV